MNQLETLLADEEIVFLFVSLDDNAAAWTSSFERHVNMEFSNSFMVANKYTSKLLDELNIKTIPRYLIYSKSGELIYANAPNPKDENCKELILELLANDK